MNDFDAHEAAEHCLKPIARFRDLHLNERFRFPGSMNEFFRTKSGYKFANDPRCGTFRTGARTAVIPIQGVLP